MPLNSSHPGPVRGAFSACGPLGASVLVAAGLLTCGVSAPHAENDRASATQFLIQENARAAQSVHAAPTPVVHHAAPTFRRVLMQRAASEHRPRSFVSASTSPTAVVVYGDRLGQALANSLQEDGGNAVAVSASTSEDAGLTRSDFDPWLQSIRERLSKTDRASVAVVMLGSNDRQSLADGGTTVEPDTPHWQDLYGARVDAVANVFRDAHVPLIWVGLPTVHSDETSAEFVRLNGIFRDHAARDGATYVDSWEAFSDDAGRYSPMGPDVEGQTVKLRKADGFGFTRAGARKLASFVERDIKRLQRPGPDGSAPEVANIAIDRARDFDQALDIDVNAQIRREAGLSPEAASAAAVRTSEPAKPAAGPVMPLTTPPLSPDGHLATASDAMQHTANAMQASLLVKPLGADNPITPKPGRADDFSWPRQ